jgi:hypothetical protein
MAAGRLRFLAAAPPVPGVRPSSDSVGFLTCRQRVDIYRGTF